jgi:putative acetyltransferase
MSDSNISLRKQNRSTDLQAIYAINAAAFAEHGGTKAFDQFREQRNDIVSLVALVNEQPVGHVLFSPVVMATPTGAIQGMGLGQLAVSPEWQNKGIGTHLAEVGIARLREQHCPFIIVIGHASYYPRFGFEQGHLHNVNCQWDSVADEAFMVLYLEQDLVQQKQLCGVASFDGM